MPQNSYNFISRFNIGDGCQFVQHCGELGQVSDHSFNPNLNPRRGYLVYLSDGDVPFFRVSFSPIFSKTGYRNKANFLEQVVKTCQKRKFCYNRLLFSQIFVFLSIFFTDFS